MSPEDELDLRRLILVEFSLSERTAATCFGKQQFESFELAESVLARMRRSKDSTKRTVVSRCKFCGKWHICGVLLRKPAHEART